MDNELFITELMRDNDKFCKMVLKVTDDPKKLRTLSKLFEYVYDMGAAKCIDDLLP